MMRRSCRIAVGAILFALFVAASAGQAQVIDRELRERVVQKLTIAIGGFAAFNLNGEDLGKLGAAVLANDLKFTSVFDVM